MFLDMSSGLHTVIEIDPLHLFMLDEMIKFMTGRKFKPNTIQ